MDATHWRIINEDSAGETHEMVAYISRRYYAALNGPNSLRVVCSCSRTWWDHWADAFTGHDDVQAIFDQHLSDVNVENDAIEIANRLGFC